MLISYEMPLLDVRYQAISRTWHDINDIKWKRIYHINGTALHDLKLMLYWYMVILLSVAIPLSSYQQMPDIQPIMIIITSNHCMAFADIPWALG